MADKDNDLGVVGDILDSTTSSIYNLSRGFIQRNSDIIDKTRQVLNDVLDTSGSTDINNRSSAVSEYVNMLLSSVNNQDRRIVAMNMASSVGGATRTGSHFIGGDVNDQNINNSSVVDELVQEVRNHFSAMPEYDKVCEIVPEIDKVIGMIVRDVINRDEVTGKVFKNLYTDENELDKKSADRRIRTLLDEYKLEEKVSKWIRTAEVYGVKPIAVLPVGDFVDLVNREMYNIKASGKSEESLDLHSICEDKNFLKPSPLTIAHEALKTISSNPKVAIESADFKITSREAVEAIKDYMGGIIDDRFIDDWIDTSVESMKLTVSEQLNSVSSDPTRFKAINTTYESIMTSIGNSSRADADATIKAQLGTYIAHIDSSLEVVDFNKSTEYFIAKRAKTTVKYPRKYNGTSFDIGDILDTFGGDPTDGSTPAGRGNSEGNYKINIDGADIVIRGDMAKVDEIKDERKRAVIMELEPENVIPVCIAGTHAGFYIIEESKLDSRNAHLSTVRKDRGSFLDYIKKLGIDEDWAVLNNSSAGMMGNIDGNPYSNPMFSPSSMLNPHISTNGGGDRRLELLKDLIVRTVSKRLGEDELIDDPIFRSAILNIVKDDVVFRKGIRFTFIPVTNMVYMSRELSDEGFPLSAMNGTLFKCYMYISSLISSMMMKVMKAADTEILEVNMGKSNEIGLTIGSVAKNASTRSVSARSILGGTESIIRNVGSYKRIIIPVFNGEKLFDFTPVDKVGNVDIDDEYTDKQLKSIIMKIGAPPNAADLIDENDYATSLVNQHLDYRSLIIDRGGNYSSHFTKLIRLLVAYSDIGIVGSKEVEDSVNVNTDSKDSGGVSKLKPIDLKRIMFKFTPPKTLTTTKVSEEVNAASDLADKILEMYAGTESYDAKIWPVIQMLFKRAVSKEFSGTIDWTKFDEIFEEVKRSAPSVFLEMSKYNIPEKDDNSDDTTGDGGDFGSDAGDDSNNDQTDTDSGKSGSGGFGGFGF